MSYFTTASSEVITDRDCLGKALDVLFNKSLTKHDDNFQFNWKGYSAHAEKRQKGYDFKIYDVDPSVVDDLIDSIRPEYQYQRVVAMVANAGGEIVETTRVGNNISIVATCDPGLLIQ